MVNRWFISPVYTGPPTGSGFESRLRPCSAGGPSNPDHDLDRLRLHGAESRIGSIEKWSRVNGAIDYCSIVSTVGVV